ncbi:MAG: hypothetical protein Q8O62_09890 [Aequorivita sp.]|nr:hypothetical protein [Aequorivita sp.]
MKNSNDLKTFVPVVFGGGTVSGKGGDTGTGTFNDGPTYQSPPFNPNGSPNQTITKGTLSKIIEVIDINGKPLVSAHVKWGTQGTITNQNGEATVTVDSESTQITISYVGKRTHIASFANLGGLITLQENVNNLPAVVVGTTKPTTTTPPVTTPPVVATVKKTDWVKTAGIGLVALLAISALSGSGKKSKSSGSGNGLSGTKSKKRKSGKKANGKKRKGLREPATEVTL